MNLKLRKKKNIPHPYTNMSLSIYISNAFFITFFYLYKIYYVRALYLFIFILKSKDLHSISWYTMFTTEFILILLAIRFC
jgi:hypothetical protein